MDVRQDKKGWTHIDWELDGITPKMIDWWWCNLEKGFALWHPVDHIGFYWHTRPTGNRAIGTIYVAPQVWSDGSRINPHIRWEDVASLPEEVRDILVYDHVAVAAGISITGENMKEDDPPIVYRIHQYEKTDSGVRGISSAIPREPEPPEKGLVWAKHASEEIGHFQDFLADLYRLWSAVRNPEINPYFSFRVLREGKSLRYAAM